MAKTFVPNGKTRIGDARCLVDGFRVLVERHKAPLRPQPQQNSPGVAATPKGGVHPCAGRLGARAAQQRVHGFIQQDGGVLQIRGHHGP